MKNEKIMYLKAVLKMVEIYGIEYMKDKLGKCFYSEEKNEEYIKYSFCFEDESARKDLEADYKGWVVYAIVEVDRKTCKVKIIKCVLPDGTKIK